MNPHLSLEQALIHFMIQSITVAHVCKAVDILLFSELAISVTIFMEEQLLCIVIIRILFRVKPQHGYTRIRPRWSRAQEQSKAGIYDRESGLARSLTPY